MAQQKNRRPDPSGRILIALLCVTAVALGALIPINTTPLATNGGLLAAVITLTALMLVAHHRAHRPTQISRKKNHS